MTAFINVNGRDQVLNPGLLSRGPDKSTTTARSGKVALKKAGMWRPMLLLRSKLICALIKNVLFGILSVIIAYFYKLWVAVLFGNVMY